MDVITTFGFALAVPILLLSRLLSEQIATLLWLGWALVLCAYSHHHNQHRAHLPRQESRRSCCCW